jgi:hypothetical protein
MLDGGERAGAPPHAAGESGILNVGSSLGVACAVVAIATATAPIAIALRSRKM